MERTMKPVIHKKIAEWLPKELLKDGTFRSGYDRQANSLRLECGCRFDFLSYEMSLDKFGGADLHRCHYDEEPPEDIREECLMRLIDYGGDEVFSFTPLKGLTWAYRTLFKNRDDPRVHLEQVSMTDNPYLNAGFVAELMEDGPLGLSEVARQRRVEGVFTAEHGFCYPSLRDWLCDEPDRTVVSTAPEILVGIDPGYRVCGLTFTANLRNEMFLTFDTVELKATDASQYADAIGRVLGMWGIPPDNATFAIDPNNARAKNLVTGESVEDELIRHGIYPEHGQKDVMTGVMLLNRLGREGKWQISRKLTAFIERMEEYPLEENTHGELAPAKTGREHLCDSIRYALSIRTWPEADDHARKPVYPEGVAYPPPARGARTTTMGPLA
jgi:phage terminase large subunit-like protein